MQRFGCHHAPRQHLAPLPTGHWATWTGANYPCSLLNSTPSRSQPQWRHHRELLVTKPRAGATVSSTAAHRDAKTRSYAPLRRRRPPRPPAARRPQTAGRPCPQHRSAGSHGGDSRLHAWVSRDAAISPDFSAKSSKAGRTPASASGEIAPWPAAARPAALQFVGSTHAPAPEPSQRRPIAAQRPLQPKFRKSRLGVHRGHRCAAAMDKPGQPPAKLLRACAAAVRCAACDACRPSSGCVSPVRPADARAVRRGARLALNL